MEEMTFGYFTFEFVFSFDYSQLSFSLDSHLMNMEACFCHGIKKFFFPLTIQTFSYKVISLNISQMCFLRIVSI